VIQLLTPQQRAALILRDLLGWSAKETAELLEVTVAAANSALQRARATLRQRFPSRRPAWPAGVDASAAERALLERYVAAAEEANVAVIASLIREDATFRMPPQPGVRVGRDAMIREWVDAGFGTESFGRMRCAITRANGQPAVAAWIRRDGDARWEALAIDVLRIEDGQIAEAFTFGPHLFLRSGCRRHSPTEGLESIHGAGPERPAPLPPITSGGRRCCESPPTSRRASPAGPCRGARR